VSNWPDSLRGERKRLGLTQRQADVALGLGQGTVASWETARNTPHPLTQKGALDTLRSMMPPPKQRASNDKISHPERTPKL